MTKKAENTNMRETIAEKSREHEYCYSMEIKIKKIAPHKKSTTVYNVGKQTYKKYMNHRKTKDTTIRPIMTRAN